MAGLGLVSTSRPTALGPVFVTPAPASTDAAEALPKFTAGGDAAPALVDTEAKPTVQSTNNAPSAEILRTAREVAVGGFIREVASPPGGAGAWAKKRVGLVFRAHRTWGAGK